MQLKWTEKSSGDEKILRFDVVTKESVESVLNITKHPVEDGEDIVDNAHPEPAKIMIEGYISNAPLPTNPGVFWSLKVEKTMSLEAKGVALNLNAANQPPDLPSRTLKLDYGNAGEPDKNFPISPGALTKSITGAISSLFGKPPPRPEEIQGYNGLTRSPLPEQAQVFKGVDGFENRARAIYTALARAQAERARITISLLVVDLDDMLIAKLSAPRAKEDGSGTSIQLEMQRVRIVKSQTVDAPVAAESRGQKQESKGTKLVFPYDEDRDEVFGPKRGFLRAGVLSHRGKL